MKVTIRIDGEKQVIRNLVLYKAHTRMRLVKAIAESALQVQKGAKQRCPVDTGRLRSDIKIKFSAGGLGAAIGTVVHYAPHVEFGTYKMQSQPFLFPAYEEARPDIIRRIRKAMGGFSV